MGSTWGVHGVSMGIIWIDCCRTTHRIIARRRSETAQFRAVFCAVVFDGYKYFQKPLDNMFIWAHNVIMPKWAHELKGVFLMENLKR
jgi:hypothetical protein